MIICFDAAGTGYWAHMLRQRHPKLEMFAYDVAPPSHSETSEENTYHGRAKAWTSVEKGGVDRLTVRGAATLFLCYPPPDNNMALDALRSYTGETVCYVGEYRGDTGTARFEALLDASFQCVEEVPLPNWGDTCYSLTIWRRVTLTAGAEVVSSLHHPSRCTVCGVLKATMYRCRLSYGVTFCSNSCAAAGCERHKDELTFKYLLYTSSTEKLTSEELPSKKKRKVSESSSCGASVGPLFDVKSSFFTVLKIKCPWL